MQFVLSSTAPLHPILESLVSKLQDSGIKATAEGDSSYIVLGMDYGSPDLGIQILENEVALYFGNQDSEPDEIMKLDDPDVDLYALVLVAFYRASKMRLNADIQAEHTAREAKNRRMQIIIELESAVERHRANV